MTHFRISTFPLAAAAAIALAGCAASPARKPPAIAPPPPVAATPAPAPDLLKTAAAVPPKPFEGEGWQPLGNWHETDYAGRGEVRVESGAIVMGMGSPFTGIRWTNEFPKVDYEIAFDAMRTMGTDFFCGLTVPVGESHCSLVVGGWGGGLVGISSLDGYDASENETTKFMGFDKGRWYRIRLRVTTGRIEGWIDGEKLVNVDTTGRTVALRPGEIEASAPLGISCWETGAAVREIRWRRVAGPEGLLKQ